MRIEVNSCRLYVDVLGSGLVPDGPTMVERPVVFLLHGGPGSDHSGFKPGFDPLSDVAQLVFYDHRGGGRSDKDKSENWNLDQWADDLRGLIDVLGVERPIVLGVSFGGFVAQNYAIRHPDRLHKLILVSTIPRIVLQTVYDAFQKFGGDRARQAAENFWSGASRESAIEYAKVCLPLYTQQSPDTNRARRALMALDVMGHFQKPGGENLRFDYREGLQQSKCPALVIAGDLDPITPIEAVSELANYIPHEHLRFETFAGCGHGVVSDDLGVLDVLKDFIGT